MTAPPRLHLGSYRSLSDPKATGPAHVPAHHLVTHGVVTGMTGSGKTGLLIVMIEEALRAGVPALIIDVKGDMPNLLLRFPQLSAEALLPWAENHAPGDTRTQEQRAAALADSTGRGCSAGTSPRAAWPPMLTAAPCA